MSPQHLFRPTGVFYNYWICSRHLVPCPYRQEEMINQHACPHIRHQEFRYLTDAGGVPPALYPSHVHLIFRKHYTY